WSRSLYSRRRPSRYGVRPGKHRVEHDAERLCGRPIVTNPPPGAGGASQVGKKQERSGDFHHHDIRYVLAEAGMAAESEMKIGSEFAIRAETPRILEYLRVKHAGDQWRDDDRAGGYRASATGSLGDDRLSRAVADHQRQHRPEAKRLIDDLA